MNTQLLLDIFVGIGEAVGIGLAFLIIPFALLIFGRMLPWYILKAPFIRNIFFKEPKNRFDEDMRNYRESYIKQCHPSQVIKRLRQDGIQSIFREYCSSLSPTQKPEQFSNEDTPSELFNCSNPIPIDNKLNYSLDGFIHTDNLPKDNNDVNHKQTEPFLGKTQK